MPKSALLVREETLTKKGREEERTRQTTPKQGHQEKRRRKR